MLGVAVWLWKDASIVFATAALAAGLWAVRLWHKSAKVELNLELANQTGCASFARQLETAALINASTEAAALNRRAAKMTAWAVVLSAASSILGAI